MIAEVMSLLRRPEYDYLTYKKLDEPELQKLWEQKCTQKIGKATAQCLLTYSP